MHKAPRYPLFRQHNGYLVAAWRFEKHPYLTFVHPFESINLFRALEVLIHDRHQKTFSMFSFLKLLLIASACLLQSGLFCRLRVVYIVDPTKKLLALSGYIRQNECAHDHHRYLVTLMLIVYQY